MLQQLHEINSELTKSFKNVNYSQWERRKPSLETKKETINIQQQATVVTSASSNGSKASSQMAANQHAMHSNLGQCPPNCPHHRREANLRQTQVQRVAFKTKKQLKDEEDQRNLLRLKIKYAKEQIDVLKKREYDLIEMNTKLAEYIDGTEKNSNENVDSILKRYEKYQEVKKTIRNKHFEELEIEKKELEMLKANLAAELPKYEQSSNEMETKLKEAQDLNRLLSIYKNQEYPEKLLQINKLRKKLGDLNNIHNEEHDDLKNMIKREKDAMNRTIVDTTKNISDQVSQMAIQEMHDSLRDMANFNKTIVQEIEFYKNHIDNLKFKIAQLQKEIDELKEDKRRDFRNNVFADILDNKKPICSPDEDIIIDYSI